MYLVQIALLGYTGKKQTILNRLRLNTPLNPHCIGDNCIWISFLAKTDQNSIDF